MRAMPDPYDTLGVPRDADDDAIRKAYRKLAKKHHPDLNPGKADAADKFSALNAANDILSDKAKRARYDRGEIDAEGREKPPERPFYRDYASRSAGATSAQDRYSEIDPDDLSDLFGAFGGFGARPQRPANARGRDVQYSLTVDFVEAATGGKRRLSLPDGRSLDLTIPEGLEDGQVLRLKGQGQPGIGSGPPGDALIEVAVAPHRLFRRDGQDILLELPVSLQEAVLGTSVEVPTVKGQVRVSVPPGSGNGTKLRLRGRGIGGGSQVVELRVVLPAGEEPALAAFLRSWTPEHALDPRAGWAEAEAGR